MFRVVLIFLILLVSFNSYSFINEVSDIYRIIGHSLFMPIVGLIYGIKRNWQFGRIDQLIFWACLIGSMGDVVIFLDLNEKGEFLQIVTAFFVHLIFIVIFKKEGAYVFNNSNSNILKILIPSLFSFFFFGFVLLNVLPNLIYFVAILYAVEVTILTVLGYFRPTSNKNYWIVAVGVTVIILKDILYSFYFYVYQSTHHWLYIPFYLSNAIGYFTIIYGIALNQNEKKEVNEKISFKVILNTSILFFKKKEIKSIKSRIFDLIFIP